MSVAKLVSKRAHQVPGKLTISEYFFEVPLNHASPLDGSLRLFARSIERFEKPVGVVEEEAKPLPWRGPGFPCKSPQNYGWTEKALDKGYQIVFLDQRGTGLSSTVTEQTLARHGGPMAQATYLRHFRADSIVEDCEAIRRNLTSEQPEEKQKWSIIGQSFGGFCCLNYLSAHPEGLREAFILGGLAPIVVEQPDPVYQNLYHKVAERNRSYYAKYSEDIQRVKNIIHYLQTEKVKLPTGGTLSIARFRQLGINFGFHGGIDAVHEIILRLDSDLEYYGYFTRPTLSGFESTQGFDDNPLYALMHEAIYLQGHHASNWSADRVMKDHPVFMNLSTSNDEPIYFTGEMIYPSMFRDYTQLRNLAPTADILAQMTDWPALYSPDRLANTNDVPVYASIYVDDVYVSYDLARATAARVRKCKTFITNAMYHDAIGAAGKSEEVFRRLFALREDVLD
ncbi:MAG: hypothetical protein LQ339_001585 [Xanthoria mediterranea]|nr:MAG: hypothetical protein LQ339_001585 [Xanthoria mediterranea]